jgi:hypothetical protein
MASFQELFDLGELQLYQTVTVSNELPTGVLTPVSVQVIEDQALTTGFAAGLPTFIPATMDPRVTPVIIFG